MSPTGLPFLCNLPSAQLPKSSENARKSSSRTAYSISVWLCSSADQQGIGGLPARNLEGSRAVLALLTARSVVLGEGQDSPAHSFPWFQNRDSKIHFLESWGHSLLERLLHALKMTWAKCLLFPLSCSWVSLSRTRSHWVPGPQLTWKARDIF